MSTNSQRIKEFPLSHFLKITVPAPCFRLCPCYPPLPLLHLFSSPPPCCSTQLNSTSTPPPPPPHPQLLCFSSPLLSTSAVLSSLLTAPSLPLLSVLSCGSRGLICSPNILNRIRANANKGERKKHLRAYSFTISQAIGAVWGCVQSVKIERRAVSAPWARFSAVSHIFTDSTDFNSTQRIALINHIN